jgi:hypothetical protein
MSSPSTSKTEGPNISQILTYSFGGVLTLGLLLIYIYIGSYVGNKDTNNELSKQLLIIGVGTLICVIAYGVLAYMYFASNTEGIIPYLLISQTAILFVSLFSLGISSIQVS